MLIIWVGYLYVVVTIGIVMLFGEHPGQGVVVLLFGAIIPTSLGLWVKRKGQIARRERAAEAEAEAAARADDNQA